MMTQEEKDRILAVVATIYASGYSEGIAEVVNAYEVSSFVPKAALEMPKALEARLALVDKSLEKYLDAIRDRAASQSAKGLSGDALMHDVTEYAKGLVNRHAEIVTQIEFAKGRMDGAKSIMDATGVPYEFRFPHFDIQTPGHEVCPICEGIAAGSPFTPEEAEALGYPDVPHPNCDHGWVIVPKGELTRTEEYAQGPADVPYHLLED